MMFYGNHMSAGGWALMSLGMLAFWGLLIAGAVMFFRSIGAGPRSGDRRGLRPPPRRGWGSSGGGRRSKLGVL